MINVGFRRFSMALTLAGLAGATQVGCSEGAVSLSSGSTCPPGSSLTYENFGEAFFGQYCVGCHSSELSGAARNNAPGGVNFDSLEGIRAVGASHIDSQAAAGPGDFNAFMPPNNPRPSDEEREQLGEWLACGMP